MKKRYLLVVRGKQHEWLFKIDAAPEHVVDWRDDGLEVNELVNSIPYWIAGTVLMRPWIFIQDVFHFRNPFRA